jgi:hypothetical protein
VGGVVDQRILINMELDDRRPLSPLGLVDQVALDQVQTDAPQPIATRSLRVNGHPGTAGQTFACDSPRRPLVGAVVDKPPSLAGTLVCRRRAFRANFAIQVTSPPGQAPRGP